MVHQCCVGNFLRSIGDYADLIPEFQFTLKRPIWNRDSFVEYATHIFTLSLSKGDAGDDDTSSSVWRLSQHEDGGRVVCQCALDILVEKVNDQMPTKPNGQAAIDFADSEEFADFVWRMRKSKQWPQYLKLCKECKQVVFND